MTKIFITALLICTVGSFTTVQAQNIKLVDPLEPVYPDTNYLEQYSDHYNEDFPINADADVHILIETTPGSTITIAADINEHKLPLSAWSQLLDVPVERNTGLNSRTEIYDNQINPYVIRRAPFRIYEAIKPLKETKLTTKNKLTLLRLVIDKSLLHGAGEYQCHILVKGNKWQRS